MRRVFLLGIALLLTVPGAARSEVLATSTDEGTPPSAFVSFAILGPRTPLRIQVTAAPEDVLKIDGDLQCYKNDSEHRSKIDFAHRRGPIEQRVGLPVRRPSFCFVTLKASTEKRPGEGRITLRAFGSAELSAPLRR